MLWDLYDLVSGTGIVSSTYLLVSRALTLVLQHFFRLITLGYGTEYGYRDFSEQGYITEI
jgi:hypothetical protein